MRRRGKSRAYGSYKASLEDREIDAVYIAVAPMACTATGPSPPPARGSTSCVKSPSPRLSPRWTRWQTRRSETGCAAGGRHDPRYHPQTRQLQERLAAGVIGDIRLIRGVFTSILARPGDIDSTRLWEAVRYGTWGLPRQFHANHAAGRRGPSTCMIGAWLARKASI